MDLILALIIVITGGLTAVKISKSKKESFLYILGCLTGMFGIIIVNIENNIAYLMCFIGVLAVLILIKAYLMIGEDE